MANSFVRYTGNGSTTAYAIPFTYIDSAHLACTVNGSTASFALNSAGTQATLSSVPANGSSIEFRRTSSQTTRLTDYVSGAVLTESALDTDSTQGFFMSQEAVDDANDKISLDSADFQWSAGSKRIKNITDPTSNQDAATKGYLENTWLTTANKTALTTINANIANINAVNSNASNVNTVSANNANVTTVATNIGSVNTVATDIAKVIAVANDLAEAVSEIETVADDLNEATSEIDTVSNNIANVNTVGGISSDVTTVAGISANVTTVAGNNANVTAVAGNSSNITAVATNATNINAVNANSSNINTVAGNNSNVSTVAGIDSDVTGVAGISSAVTAVNSNSSNINTVSGNNSNVSTVAGISGNVSTVAGIASDVTAVAGDATDIGAVAGIASAVSAVNSNSSNINAVNSNSSNINTVAANDSNITTVANADSNITAVAGNASNINTVGAAIANVNNVGGSIANVNTVAGSLTSVNAFGETYRIGSSNPTSSLDVGDLFYNTSDTTLKVYDGTGWTAGVTAGSGFLPLTGGGLTGALTTNSTLDGRDVATDGTKLDGIEASATADQTGAEIKSAYEGESDTNAFTDALQTKLNGIETSATADQTKSDIDALNINADTLDGQHGSYYTGYADTAVSNLVDSSPSALNTLNELASALGDDANFSTTITNSIASTNTTANSANTTANAALPKAGGAMTGNITHGDNVKATFGASNDLEIYHDGTNSFIKDVGTGGLYLRGDAVLGLGVSNETAITCNLNGSVDIMYDDVKKFETTSDGCEITGQLTVSNDLKLPDNSELRIGSATNGDLLIYHDGSNSYIQDTGTGALEIWTDELKIKNSSGSENGIYFAENGAVNLYHDSNLKANTTSSGFEVTGTTTSSGNVIGDGIIHKVGGTEIGRLTSSGNNFYIRSSVSDGDILIQGNDGGTTKTFVAFDSSDNGNATFNANVTVSGSLQVNSNIVASGNVTAYSDQRLKSDIKTIDNALDKVSQMRGVTFTKDDQLSSGVIAQEMEQVAPELVMDGEYKSVAYGNTVGYLIEAIKELKAEVEELKTKKLCECK